MNDYTCTTQHQSIGKMGIGIGIGALWRVELPGRCACLPRLRLHHTPFISIARPALLQLQGRKPLGLLPLTTKHFSGPEDKNLQPSESDEKLDVKSTSELFMRWEIPWDGKTVLTTMAAFGMSFLFTGLAVSILLARLGLRQRQLLDMDEQSLLLFINQILQTFVGTSVIKACTKSYSPLPNELFSYDWRDPFSASRGWLLWGVVGTFCGTGAVLLAGTLTTYVNGEPLPREGQDALLQLLPLIGASRTSTALLLAVTGILAPYLEETVFRGFLMTSLTKWVPTYVAVILSAGAFALAHFTPGEIPQLFALGVVLGFSYSKSGNLLTPIMIHGLWNSGVLLLLTLLRPLAPLAISKGKVKQYFRKDWCMCACLWMVAWIAYWQPMWLDRFLAKGVT